MKASISKLAPIVLVLLVGICFVPRSGSGDSDSGVASSSRILDMAEGNYFSGDVDTALMLLDQVLQRQNVPDAESVTAHLLNAYCYAALGEATAAKRAIESAWRVRNELDVDPDVVPPPFMPLYYEVMDELGVDQRIQTLAVLDFSNASVTDYTAMEPLGRGIADMIQLGIMNVKDVTLVERARIDYLLEEHKLQKANMTDPRTMVEMGKLMGVRYLLTGTYVRADDRLRITHRLISVETGALVPDGAGMVDGKAKDLMDVIDALGYKALQAVARVIPLEIKKWRSEYVDPEALLLYSQGLSLMDRGEYSDARHKFLAAQEITPDFDLAERRARQLTALATIEGAR